MSQFDINVGRRPMDMNEWVRGRFDINEWAKGQFDLNNTNELDPRPYDVLGPQLLNLHMFMYVCVSLKC